MAAVCCRRDDRARCRPPPLALPGSHAGGLVGGHRHRHRHRLPARRTTRCRGRPRLLHPGVRRRRRLRLARDGPQPASPRSDGVGVDRSAALRHPRPLRRCEHPRGGRPSKPGAVIRRGLRGGPGTDRDGVLQRRRPRPSPARCRSAGARCDLGRGGSGRRADVGRGPRLRVRGGRQRPVAATRRRERLTLRPDRPGHRATLLRRTHLPGPGRHHLRGSHLQPGQRGARSCPHGWPAKGSR